MDNVNLPRQDHLLNKATGPCALPYAATFAGRIWLPIGSPYESTFTENLPFLSKHLGRSRNHNPYFRAEQPIFSKFSFSCSKTEFVGCGKNPKEYGEPKSREPNWCAKVAQYHRLPSTRSDNRTQFVVANGLAIPWRASPQSAVTQAADIATDAYGIPHMHTRGVIIMHRTCTPMPLGSLPPSFDEMPLIRCSSFSTSTGMQCYALDVQSTNGHLHSHFWQLSRADWDRTHEANPSSIIEMHTCVTSWINHPNTPLKVPDILHDIFLKTGNPRGGTHALLPRNLTNKANSTSRYHDHYTASILAPM
jgi:hypothetical protein